MNPTSSSPPPVPGSEKTSSLAITSLVFGILAVALLVVCIGLIFAIPAIICGHIAVSKIRDSNGALTGKGLAIAGFVCGYISLVFALVLLPAIAIPNFVRARQAAQRNACVNHLRTIDAAKQQWMLEKSKEVTDTPTEADLQPYVKSFDWKCPADGVYTINPVNTSPTCSIPSHKLETE